MSVTKRPTMADTNIDFNLVVTNQSLNFSGPDLHLLLLPILVRPALLVHRDHPDDNPWSLLVHPGLP